MLLVRRRREEDEEFSREQKSRFCYKIKKKYNNDKKDTLLENT